ncbi:hypothetical protein ACLMJK_008735 [Lecanora helva]
MELVMEAQDDPTPWPVAAPSDLISSPLLGRGSFSQLGIVRRKPARTDSPPTFAKSCSDKLALKQCTSLLSSVVSLIISPANAYIDTLILPASQYRAVACERSFGLEGRMKTVTGSVWEQGYAFRPFKVETTDIEFPFSRHSVAGGSKGCNISAVWTPHVCETLVNGVLQGRKQTDLKGASSISKTRLWEVFRKTHHLLEEQGAMKAMNTDDYHNFKKCDILQGREEVKRKAKENALEGWDAAS